VLVDIRSTNQPSYRCPKCGLTMLWTGTAFRPPKKGDDDGWAVVRRIFDSGFRFRPTARRMRFPKTLNEVDAWLKAQGKDRRWLAERKVSVRKGRGEAAVRWGRRLLEHGQPLLIWSSGAWHEGTLRLRGDGFIPLASPVIRLPRERRSVVLTSRSRVRLPER
jgi:hypothetical protein